MASPRLNQPPVSPTPDTVKFAQEALHLEHRFALVDAETDQRIQLPEQVYDLFRSILVDLAQNRPITVIPLAHELTTHQAADVLNVSRGFILSLIEKQILKCRMVGTHRRIRLEELLEYQAKMHAQSEAAVQEMNEISQDLGLE